MKKTLYLLFALSMALPSSAQVTPSKSNKDYKDISELITSGCNNDYERIKAIYKWICAHISYDTGYTITTADECWEKKSGVCQGYCELFYRIAEPLGIEVVIVDGESKSQSGAPGKHAWICAKIEGKNILIDPTWGAGSVDNNIFTRSKEDMSWFDVEPEWMIFSHYPKEEMYQFIEPALTYNEFLKLPLLLPSYSQMGLDAKSMLKLCHKEGVIPPKLYCHSEGSYIEIVKAPMHQKLSIGTTYEFSIKKRCDKPIALICGDIFMTEDKWTLENGVYTIKYTPQVAKGLTISYYDSEAKHYGSLITYLLLTPTAEDLKRLEENNPFNHPDIKKLKGMNSHYMETLGVDGKKLLDEIRSGSIERLPDFYSDKHIKIVDIPLNGVLRTGTTYKFSIKKESGNKIAIICGDNFVTDESWKCENDIYTLEYTPGVSTDLKIASLDESKSSFSTLIKYQIAEATDKDIENLSQKNPMDMPEVKRLMTVNAHLYEPLGFDGNKLLAGVQDGSITSLPQAFSDSIIRVIDVPLNGEMHPGTEYQFRIKKIADVPLAIICGSDVVTEDKWECTDGIYTIKYIPPIAEGLHLSFKNSSDDMYWTILMYTVVKPTDYDIEHMAETDPFSLPEIQALEGVNSGYMKRLGVDGNKVLAGVRDGSITTLPKFYSDEYFKIVDIPLNGTLKVGETYTFKIKPTCEGRWAAVYDGRWNYIWKKIPETDEQQITITPTKPGRLRISVRLHEGESYHVCIEYEVK